MKKIAFLMMLTLFVALPSKPQSVKCSFSGQDHNGHYLRLDGVTVTNITQGWQVALSYPDTVLEFRGVTGIEDYCDYDGLTLFQNVPNPFSGVTDVMIQVAAPGETQIEVFDLNGHLVANCTQFLLPGRHRFVVELSLPQTYILTVQSSGHKQSIKMINKGTHQGNNIVYAGKSSAEMPVLKLETENPFSLLDSVSIVGAATINGVPMESDPISGVFIFLPFNHQVFMESHTAQFTLLFHDIIGNDTVSYGHPCIDLPSVVDVDGNVYNTVQIGTQCWMKENLRTTHYADGTLIPLAGSTSTISEIMPYRYCPNGDASNVLTMGFLYNWNSVMHNSPSSPLVPSGVQGICPDGWHVPSHGEWSQLINYVGGQSELTCGNVYQIPKSLASDVYYTCMSHWCDQVALNATGFSAIPAGYIKNIGFEFFGETAAFWSCTESDAHHAYNFDLFCGNMDVNQYADNYKLGGWSVRCLKD